MRNSTHQMAIMAALVAALGGTEAPIRERMDDTRRRSGGEPGPSDGRVISVSREVYDEALKAHTLAEINAMPYPQRLEVIQEAHRRVAERQRQSSNEAAVQLREERARRKAEAWAKRQPKTRT